MKNPVKKAVRKLVVAAVGLAVLLVGPDNSVVETVVAVLTLAGIYKAPK